MCGITGYARALCSDAPLEGPEVLGRMTDALTHRGPDAEGRTIRDRVALGHRRLSVIDLAGGAQPMTDPSGDLAIVFGGEIYNYLSLNEELARLGYRARTRSDTETILNAYAAWGDDCVHRLNGMFAFVIHDRARRRLFGARDRMGQKPFYYVHDGPFFAFASEPRALLLHPAVRREMDPDALVRYLLFEHVPAPLCIFKGMRKLEAGHRFSVDLRDGRLALGPWWDLGALGPVDGAASEGDWVELIRTALDEAVGRRLAADVPLGVFLSGGIDSAAVTAAMAARLGGGDVKTFTLGFGDPQFDESVQARAVAETLGTDHHEERVEPREVRDAIDAVTRILDEPLADASILPTWLLARFARRHVTVALGGDGGDELFAGYQTFKALPAARLYNALVPRLVHRAVVRPLASRLPVREGYFSLDFKVKRFLRGVKVPEHERLWRWLGAFDPPQLAGLLSPDVLEQADPGAGFERLRWLADVDGAGDAVARDSRLYARTYLADGVLTKVDRATMACSLEARSPLLDPDLVKLAAAIPGRLKVRGLRLKHVFRQALEGLVPQEVLDAPKRGFAAPVAEWFRGDLRDELLDTLDERAIRAEGLFRPEAVTRLVTDHLEGRHNHRKPLFTLFMFERWRRRWLDRAAEPAHRAAA